MQEQPVKPRRADEAAAALPKARVAADPVEPVEPPDDDLAADGPAEPAAPEPATLDERAVRILAFEKQWWKHAGAKEQAIRDTFGLSATRYYQVLNALLDDPAALAHDATTVGR